MQECFPAWKLPNNPPPRPAPLLSYDVMEKMDKSKSVKSPEHIVLSVLYAYKSSQSQLKIARFSEFHLGFGRNCFHSKLSETGQIVPCTGSLNHTISVVQTEVLCVTSYKLTEPIRALSLVYRCV